MSKEASDSFQWQDLYKVLVYETHEEGVDPKGALSPDFGLASQGLDVDGTLRSLAGLIEIRLQDIMMGAKYTTPRRGPPEVFQAFEVAEEEITLDEEHPLNTIQDPRGTGVIQVIVRRTSAQFPEIFRGTKGTKVQRA